MQKQALNLSTLTPPVYPETPAAPWLTQLYNKLLTGRLWCCLCRIPIYLVEHGLTCHDPWRYHGPRAHRDWAIRAKYSCPLLSETTSGCTLHRQRAFVTQWDTPSDPSHIHISSPAASSKSHNTLAERNVPSTICCWWRRPRRYPGGSSCPETYEKHLYVSWLRGQVRESIVCIFLLTKENSHTWLKIASLIFLNLPKNMYCYLTDCI